MSAAANGMITLETNALIVAAAASRAIPNAIAAAFGLTAAFLAIALTAASSMAEACIRRLQRMGIVINAEIELHLFLTLPGWRQAGNRLPFFGMEDFL